MELHYFPFELVFSDERKTWNNYENWLVYLTCPFAFSTGAQASARLQPIMFYFPYMSPGFSQVTTNDVLLSAHEPRLQLGYNPFMFYFPYMSPGFSQVTTNYVLLSVHEPRLQLGYNQLYSTFSTCAHASARLQPIIFYVQYMSPCFSQVTTNYVLLSVHEPRLQLGYNQLYSTFST